MSRTDKIGTHKTRIETDADGVHVRYHNTRVISRAPDGTITLRTGGWRTVTTKLRINQAFREWGLPFSLYQKHHAWYVQRLPWDSTPAVPFFDETLTLRSA